MSTQKLNRQDINVYHKAQHCQDMDVYGCHGDYKLVTLSQDDFMKEARSSGDMHASISPTEFNYCNVVAK